MESFFFKFQIRFRIIGRKLKNIQNRGVNIIKVQYVIYLWIYLDKLYKLIESFSFQISKSLFEFTTIFLNNSGVGFMQATWGKHLC